MPDEDKIFDGSLVLDLENDDVQAKNWDMWVEIVSGTRLLSNCEKSGSCEQTGACATMILR